jgi:23S rRNA (uridine2552-2'-O)-methyltransferase
MVFKVKDHYFKKAKKENFLARSVYKLEEIDQRFNLISAGNSVCDLGYHPGSWIQYCSKKVGPKGNIVGVDIKEKNSKLNGLMNVKLFQYDIFTLKNLELLGVSQAFDVVLSDMAPNTSGIKSLDQDRSLNLVEKVFEMLDLMLIPNGNMVIKVFDSQNAQNFLKSKKKLFKEWHFLKPKSTRTQSKEFFAIGKGFGKI